MKFEEAMTLMREGKQIKLPECKFSLSIENKIYFNGSTSDRELGILSTDHMLREDWEVVE